MHIHIVPNRQSTPTVLLRESFRENGKIKKRTLANLSSLPANQIELIRAVLRGDALAPATAAFEITRSQPHGHVQVVAAAMKRLEIHKLLGSQPSPERDRVVAMIAGRILRPQTKLSTVRWWETTTLAEETGVTGATEDDLYAAMDWLLERQDAIQAKLARRHLQDGAVALYDLSSSYYEGATCPLAKRGYSRDGKQGTLKVNYGLLADSRGCPVAVTVYDGNTGDPATFGPEVDRLKKQFAIDRVVLVADRGMISHKAVDELKTQQGVDWISALKTVSIRALVESGAVQLDLFDDRNLFEATAADYPGERLIACRNPQLAKLRGHKRGELLATTEAALRKISERVKAGRLTGKDRIGLAIGKVINRHKMAKHILLDIADDSFTFSRDKKKIEAEATLDGVYIIRTSLDADRMSAPDCVRTYKNLAKVERAFRTMKSVDLRIRPIHHRLPDRVRAHIFLCTLAYYVEWHMLQAWAPLLFTDEDQDAKAVRDPVAPARRSEKALKKVQTRKLEDGSPTHSFSTLLAELATITRNTCRAPGAGTNPPAFHVVTTPNNKQAHALELINAITL
jgi:Transposase DDE domain